MRELLILERTKNEVQNLNPRIQPGHLHDGHRRRTRRDRRTLPGRRNLHPQHPRLILSRPSAAERGLFFISMAFGRGDSGAREPNTTRHNSDGRPCAKLDDSIRPVTSSCRSPKSIIRSWTKRRIHRQPSERAVFLCLELADLLVANLSLRERPFAFLEIG